MCNNKNNTFTFQKEEKKQNYPMKEYFLISFFIEKHLKNEEILQNYEKWLLYIFLIDEYPWNKRDIGNGER